MSRRHPHRTTDLTRRPVKDTPVSHADEPADPIPADDAPHAYVAVKRTHSMHADRPEWEREALVIPEWDRDELDWRRGLGCTLIPIGPDGDTGTRAITEPDGAVEKLAAIRALATKWATQWGAENPLLASAGTQWQIEDGRALLRILDGEGETDGD